MTPAPITAVIPTRNRAASLRRTLLSLSEQSVLPQEIIVIDGSDELDSRAVVDAATPAFLPSCNLIWVKAAQMGAAVQRNQGCALASREAIWFFDDDVVFGSECLSRLWSALQRDDLLGGVSALIMNQQYGRPGIVSRILFALMSGKWLSSYAGRVLGPAVNLLPQDGDDLPEVVPVEWLNTTCTLYRSKALPKPPFDSFFGGYSLMEDLTLSLRVGTRWRLANVRKATIFHDSQPGSHKADVCAMSCMELVNRHYVMKEILRRDRILDYLKLFVWESFHVANAAIALRFNSVFIQLLKGKMQAIRSILRSAKTRSSNAPST